LECDLLNGNREPARIDNQANFRSWHSARIEIAAE
jgi:hypothetical protein